MSTSRVNTSLVENHLMGVGSRATRWEGPPTSMVDAHTCLLRDEMEDRWSTDIDALDAMCQYALLPSGKLFRPVLLLESALAVGGQINHVLPAAIGTECGHVASLIHDDIIDADEFRRGRASVQHKFGIDNAIVAGDHLIFYLFLCLAECRRSGVASNRIVSALEIVATAGVELCRGQSLELEFTSGAVYDGESYLTMVRLKTAALFRAACQSGAVLGGGSDELVDALGSYGDRLGIAFQIHDDLLPYTSDSDTMGKSASSDISNRRLTLPVIRARQFGTAEDRRSIDDALSGDLPEAEALETMRDVLERTGAMATATEAARRYASEARQALKPLPSTPSRDQLAHFAELAINRAQ